MKPLRSIRWRLQLWYGLLLAALIASFGVTAYRFERNVRFENIDDELQVLAYQLALKNRQPQAPGKKQPPHPPPPPQGKPDDSAVSPAFSARHNERGFYYRFWARNYTPPPPSAKAPAEIPEPPEGSGARWRGTLREVYFTHNPGDVTLVGRDLAVELAASRAFAWKLAGLGGGAFVVTLLIGHWLTVRALRPIREISDAAQTIATGDLSRRINNKDTDSELGELAAVLNSSFARLDAAFTQQSRFTADAAHELRTPLTVILTHVQNALATEHLSEEQREALEACQRAAQRMRRLLHSLLQLARIDAGQEVREHITLDVAEVARECIELIQPVAAARRITVQSQLTAVNIRGDAGGMGQMMTNLLANAVHHNREGGEIRVSTSAENSQAVLVVADNGPGIAESHLPHIFERFYRADKARSGASGRTGLGLAIAKAIVDAHGGEIEAESTVGEGATFTVRLPMGH